jgi:hypothetical protein
LAWTSILLGSWGFLSAGNRVASDGNIRLKRRCAQIQAWQINHKRDAMISVNPAAAARRSWSTWHFLGLENVHRSIVINTTV